MALYREQPVPLGAGRDDLRQDVGLAAPPLAEIKHARAVDGRLLARAAQVVAAHRAGADGWCGACLAESDVLTFHPCSPANWAARVLEEFSDRRAHPGVGEP